MDDFCFVHLVEYKGQPNHDGGRKKKSTHSCCGEELSGGGLVFLFCCDQSLSVVCFLVIDEGREKKYSAWWRVIQLVLTVLTKWASDYLPESGE